MNLTKPTLLLAGSLASQTVFADDLLDRLEVASEKMSASQSQFYVSRVPELKGKLPSWEWDAEIREAFTCVLTGIEEAKGAKVTEAYVSGLEQYAQTEISTFSDLNDQSWVPNELQGEDTTIFNLMQTCRTMDISAERLKASGAWEAMQDPGVMQRLIAE